MPWIPEQHMADVHIIRQDYAKALNAWATEGSEQALANLREAAARRDRAIRMIHDEDSASVKHLSAMFRCTKATVREALAITQNERDDT